jgi:hypothetical protein
MRIHELHAEGLPAILAKTKMNIFSPNALPFIAFRVHCLYGVAVYHSQ